MSRDCPPHRFEGNRCIDCGSSRSEAAVQIAELEQRIGELEERCATIEVLEMRVSVLEKNR